MTILGFDGILLASFSTEGLDSTGLNKGVSTGLKSLGRNSVLFFLRCGSFLYAKNN